MIRRSSIILFVILLLIFMGGVYASEDNQTNDVLESNSLDGEYIELQNDDNLEASVDDSSLGSESADGNLEVSVDDSSLGSESDNGNSNLKNSNDENSLKEENAANWTELRKDLKNINGTTVNLTRDYYFVTVWTGPNSVESRVISFSKQTFTIDGHGHTLNFTSDRNTTKVGGRFDFYNCYNMTFKNIHFINAEIMNHRSNHTTFTNCTFYGIDMLIFQCSCNAKLENCTFYIPPEDYGRVAFGGKGWYDGVQDDMGGRNNIIINCKFENLRTSYSSGGALFFYGGNNTIINSSFKNCTISGTDDNFAWNMDGGGAISFGDGNNTVDGCNFTNCWTKYKGGSIYFTGGNNTISNSNFMMEDNLPECAENVTSQFGGVYFSYSPTNNNIINSSFSNFHDCDNVICSEAPLNVENSSFTDNNAKIFDILNSNNISNSNFTNNIGIILYGTNNTISNSNFTNNSNENGGAIWLVNGTVLNCTFINNSASNAGGAIYAEGTSVIDGCTFINNTATDYGGAIAYISTTDSQVYNSYFEGNNAKQGTAIYFGNNNGDENLKDSKFVLSKEDCKIELSINITDAKIIVQFLPPDDYILGVRVVESNVNRENLSYIVDGQSFNVDDSAIDSPVSNKNITIELYDEFDVMITSFNGFTSEDGIVKFDGSKLFDDTRPVRHVKAYHTEDTYFKYAEDEIDSLVGDFDKLQFLVNSIENKGVLNLTRNYTYSLGLDTITEGVLINKSIIINGNGYSINALNQSRIFKITDNNSVTFNNVTFVNAVDGAIYCENVNDVLIDDVKFINNHAVYGVIYFVGGNLTILNSEFINSTTLHEVYISNFGDVPNYEGTGLLYADATGNIIIKDSNFIKSTFEGFGIEIINAQDVVLDNVNFDSNIVRSNSYYINRYYDYSQRKWAYRYYTDIYEGLGNAYDPDTGDPINNMYIMAYINANNVNISNVVANNNTMKRFISVIANQSVIKNINVHDSTLSDTIVVKGNSTIDSVEVENISSLFKHYSKMNNDPFEDESEYWSGSIIYIDNGNGYWDENGDYQLNLGSEVVVKNINVKNIDDDYGSVVFAECENLTIENIDMANCHILRNDMNTLYTRTSNLNVSNVNITKFKADYAAKLGRFYNFGDLTLKDIIFKDAHVGIGFDLTLIMGEGDSNHNINIDSILIENVTSDVYYNNWGSGWDEEFRGFNVFEIQDYLANATISNIKFDNCYIGEAFGVEVNYLNMTNVSVINSLISENDNLFDIYTNDDLFLSDILIDNIKLLPEYNIYYSGDTYYLYARAIPNISPGISAVSNSNIYLYNINLTNSQSNAFDLINIATYNNISFKEIKIENITSPMVTLPKLRDNVIYYDNYSGIAPNSITLLSLNGITQVFNVSINNLESGIGDPIQYGKYFINITSENTTVEELSINNAAIGGFMEGHSVIISANDTLNANNIVLNNITPSIGYYHSYYNSTLDKNIHIYFAPNGDSDIFMNGENKAIITNINITNTAGGSREGSLSVTGGNINVSNVLIDNIESTKSMLTYYNEEISKYVTETGKYIRYVEHNETDENGNNITVGDYEITNEIYTYDHSSPGITVQGFNIIVDNINISNSLNDASMGEQMYLMVIYAMENANASNIHVQNVTEKPTINYIWDDESKTIKDRVESGLINPILMFNVPSGELKLSNLTIECVEGNCMGKLLEVSGNSATIENVLIKDSSLGSMYEVAIEMRLINLNIRNFTVDNIHRSLFMNSTESQDYYDRYGNFMFSQKYYTAYCYGGFAIGLGATNLNLADVNITNIYAGSYYGTLNIESDNLSANNILLENISLDYVTYNMFEPRTQTYVVEHQGESYNGGLIINQYEGYGIAGLSNVKLNNIDVMMSPVFHINDANITMENITISNINYNPMIQYDYDEDNNEFIESILYEDIELIEINAQSGIDNSDIINIINMTVDNVPCFTDSIIITSTNNVSILNSTFKNMISGLSSYEYDETLGKLILSKYNNFASGLIIKGDNVKVSDTLFENITVAGDGNYGKALMIQQGNSATVNNCTFIDVHCLEGVEYYVNMVNNTFDSKGSAIGFLGSSSASIIESRFINCSADYGGAIYVEIPLEIINSTFITNNATYGGAIYISKDAYGINIYNSTFIKNLATFNGGAIYLFEATGDMNVINESTFIGNHANHDGGAFFYNNTIDKDFFDDYQWFNRTAMFSDGLLNYNKYPKTNILNSKFENNTDHGLEIIAKDSEEGINQTVIIIVDGVDGDKVLVNITNEKGEFITDLEGNEIKNMEYTLINGSVNINLGCLPADNYNVSAYHDNYNSIYENYHDYAYHYNSTSFTINPLEFTVSTNKTIYADENLTVVVKLNNKTTGTVNITISNGINRIVYNDIPVVNGTVIYNATELYAGDYNVTVTYNGDEIFKVKSNTTNTTILQRTSKIDVRVENNTYGNTKLIVEVPKNQTGSVTVKINNQTYTKNVTNGTVEFEVSNLTVGEWKANVTFNNNRVYKDNNTIFNFNVTKANLTANVIGNNVTIKDNVSFVINIPEDFRGNVTIKIDNKIYYNGTVSDLINIITLPVGDYNADVTFYGDNKYDDTSIKTSFNVKAIEPEMIVTISNTTYGVNATATIEVSGNANGTVNITVDGKSYSAKVENGHATVQLDNVTTGLKKAEVEFITSDNFNGNTTSNTSFTVDKSNSTIDISKENNNIVIKLPKNATGNVTIYVNGQKYSRPIINGTSTLDNILVPGDNSIAVIYKGDDNYNGNDNSTRITLPGGDYGSSPFNVTVKDFIAAENRVIVNVTGEYNGDVTVIVDSHDKETKYLSNGNILFDLTNLSADKHNITVICPDGSVQEIFLDGKSSNPSVVDKPTDVTTGNTHKNIATINAEDMTRGYNSPYDYQATFLDKDGNALVNQVVIFKVKGKEYTAKTNESGIAQLKTSKLAVGSYDITIVNKVTGEQITKKLKIVKRILQNKDLKMDYRDGSTFIVKVIGDDGKIAPVGEIIDIVANGVHYVAKVDKKGFARLKIKLLPKTYKITAEYKGFKTTNKLVVKQTLKAVKKTTTVKKGKKLILKATLKWSNGKAIKGKKITFKLAGKTYTAKTNKKGIAKVTIKKKSTKKLKKGKKYTVRITYSIKEKYGNGYQTISNSVKCYVKVK